MWHGALMHRNWVQANLSQPHTSFVSTVSQVAVTFKISRSKQFAAIPCAYPCAYPCAF